MQLSKTELIIIDGYGLLFRCFFAAPDLVTRNGQSVGGINAFLHSIFKILQNLSPHKDYYIVVAFDKGTTNNTFRHTLLPSYKANRPTLPDSLISQLSLARDALDAIGIAYVESHGHEADDIIGHIIERMNEMQKAREIPHMEATIVSMDKDLMQLVQNGVRMMNSSTMQYIDVQGVIDKISVHPRHVPDYLALIGDASDNIPGVKGIGPKTAALLLNKMGDLEQIYMCIGMVSPLRIRQLLVMYKDMAFLSKKLATINYKIDGLQISFEAWRWTGITNFLSSAYSFFEDYEMQTLKNKIHNIRRNHFVSSFTNEKI